MVFHFHEGEKTRREKGKNEDILLICDSNVCVLTRRDATLYIYLVSPFILYSFSSSSSSTVVVVVWGSGQAPDHLLLPFFSLLFFYIILQVLSLSLSLMALLLETFSKSANSFWHFSLFFCFFFFSPSYSRCCRPPPVRLLICGLLRFYPDRCSPCPYPVTVEAIQPF